MMQPLCRLRRWLRALEPRARQLLDRSWLAQFQPWLEQRALFRFQRQPLARGVAAGMFCGLIPGPLQIPGTLLVCAWLRGNVVAGGVATFYTNPLTTVPLYVMAFYLGALVMPGAQTLPAWSSVAPDGEFTVQALGTWMQALGTPLLIGLPTLGLLLAVLVVKALMGVGAVVLPGPKQGIGPHMLLQRLQGQCDGCGHSGGKRLAFGTEANPLQMQSAP